MTGIEQLVAPSFHDFVDISSFLRACQTPSQHGRIAPQDDGDATSISTLSLFMGRAKQVGKLWDNETYLHQMDISR